MPAPDFSGGCPIVYDDDIINKVYETGRGSIKLRSKYQYDKKENCIDVLSIPSSTTCEAIIEKIIEKVKAGSLKEISDIRDETDKSGLKITIDLKRGVDAEKLMKRLYKMTPLEDSFSANFNILVAGVPRPFFSVSFSNSPLPAFSIAESKLSSVCGFGGLVKCSDV